MTRPRVVIIGAGFGGLYAARTFKNTDVDVLVIDRTNHHVFQPLLYQVATATLAPTDICAPIRWLLQQAAQHGRRSWPRSSRIDPASRVVHLRPGPGFRVRLPHPRLGRAAFVLRAPGVGVATRRVSRARPTRSSCAAAGCWRSSAPTGRGTRPSASRTRRSSSSAAGRRASSWPECCRRSRAMRSPATSVTSTRRARAVLSARRPGRGSCPRCRRTSRPARTAT